MDKIAIIGFGSIGETTANEFFKKGIQIVGFDNNKKKINELKDKYDFTITNNIKYLKDCNYFIIAVNTGIYKNKKPDLNAVTSVTKTLGKIIKKGDTIIYESTVYIGFTEEICIPLLEKHSNFKCGIDFYCGYSPERINLGDNVNTLSTINKVISGFDEISLNKIKNLYQNIIKGELVVSNSIKEAEASKLVENAQRDINIAFMNELKIIFEKSNIDLNNILNNSKTKWNFLNFSSGLVGGNCLNIATNYLIYNSNKVKHNSKFLQNARNINENIVDFHIKKIKELTKDVKTVNILMIGITFKKNYSSVKYSKNIELYFKLKENGFNVDIFDPIADKNELLNIYNIKPVESFNKNYNLGVICVNHSVFENVDFTTIKNIYKI